MSDHGSTYVNFDTEILMMGKTNDPVDAALHNLVSGNSKGREKYCETLQALFTQHKIFTKINWLYNKIKNGRYTRNEVTVQYE
eukprot:3286927-Ditylum_brightwellii.AAC.1